MSLNILKLNRIYQQDCTLGVLTFGGFRCFTLELPWKYNRVNESCIPAGYYAVERFISASNGECLMLKDVPGRTWIQIHSGNFVGQSEGCILVGHTMTYLDDDNTPDVSRSRDTLRKLLDSVSGEMILEIS